MTLQIKLVLHNNKFYKHRVSLYARGLAMVEYFLDTWVTPPEWLQKLGYGIFTFDSLQNALEFIMSPENVEEIWLAKCEQEMTLPEEPYMLQEIENGSIVKSTSQKCGFPIWPPKTRMWERIMLDVQLHPSVFRKCLLRCPFENCHILYQHSDKDCPVYEAFQIENQGKKG